ncbi:MAG: F0F1 ATP synthase subunit gamma [Legionellales bacterium]|nr:F0F1 ATP synthase subunit gamma [Legionellales bacterium]|tara:strand:+ start:91427 stop:92293 length:867 start_codon:yes stop_codon:yes gene_type:complete
MASGKEIRSKIDSIKKTQKITKAMELVAASKMRKAQDRMFTSRPYADKMLQVISHIAACCPEYHHPYFEKREVKRVGYVIITSDRGLCGSLNTGLFKQTLQKLRDFDNAGVEIDLGLIGSKALHFFKRLDVNVVAQADHLGDSPSTTDIVGVLKVMLDAYQEGKIDALYIAYNKFVNTMQQTPINQQLLPLVKEDTEDREYHWDYIYEPDAKDLLDMVLQRYMESQVYQSVVENIASEQAARMMAMKSATDNAGELIDELHLIYNKARQAAITQEIAEIVGGAAAVES